MEKISVIVPCYNEEKALPLFYEELNKHMKEFPENIEFEIDKEIVVGYQTFGKTKIEFNFDSQFDSQSINELN